MQSALAFAGRRHSRGFTLFEILVALAILTAVLVVSQQAFSGSLHSLRAGDEYTRASAFASAQLNTLLADPELEAGTLEKTMRDGELGLPGRWQWRADIEPHVEETLEDDSGLGRRARFIPLALSVEVEWGGRSVRLAGLYLSRPRDRR